MDNYWEVNIFRVLEDREHTGSPQKSRNGKGPVVQHTEGSVTMKAVMCGVKDGGFRTVVNEV